MKGKSSICLNHREYSHSYKNELNFKIVIFYSVQKQTADREQTFLYKFLSAKRRGAAPLQD